MSNEPLDIVAAGYDAGIRLGEVIERDMTAVPVSGDLRLLVVGAPAYFTRHPRPRHPRDLAEHECLNWHPTADALPYRWEFTEPAATRGPGGDPGGELHGEPHAGRDFAVAVRGRVLTNDPALLIRLARAGRGLAMLYEGQVRDDLTRGNLVPVLEEFSTPFPGFYLYYPQRRHASPAPLRCTVYSPLGCLTRMERHERQPRGMRGTAQTGSVRPHTRDARTRVRRSFAVCRRSRLTPEALRSPRRGRPR